MSPAMRVTRATIFAAICVLLSAIGHGEVSRHSVAPSALLLAFAGTSAVSWAVADRQRGILAIGSGLLGLQVVLHLWFGVAGGHGGHDMSGAAGDPHALGMMAVHSVAAVVCAVWLWCGEVALFALLRALYARMVVPLLLVLVHSSVTNAVPGSVVGVDPGVPVLRGALLRYVMARRGPPIGLIA
ncbi:hypothetical protein [Nocardia sp. NPDC049707]|uniref:hypothetical protein n=1 Tax=Nocardia sp. NPDC049707 TaxID=3154735 RepID=UPI00342E9794